MSNNDKPINNKQDGDALFESVNPKPVSFQRPPPPRVPAPTQQTKK